MNKTNSEIVNSSYSLIRDCCSYQRVKYSIPAELYDDLIQDIATILLEYPNDKLNWTLEHNHLNALITGILVRQLYSKNSDFYRKYLRFKQNSEPLSYEDGETRYPEELE